MPSLSDVSVVIPNWNGGAMLATVLACLKRQTLQPSEVIVVDNGSTDNSTLDAERDGAQVIRLPENRGFCRAVNQGLRNANGTWILILNNDVELADDWLETLVRRSESRDAWFATGKLLSTDRPAYLDGTFDAICRGACAWRCGAGRVDGPAWSAERKIRLAPFTAAIFRAELFRRVGMLDERFESYLEDVDFGIRCATKGLAGVYVPNATARHRGSATLGRWHPKTVRQISRNQLLLVARHFPRHWIFRYGWPVLIGQALWGLVALRHGAFIPFLQGKWQGIRMFHSMRPDFAAEPQSLQAVLRESENEIRDLQRQTGYDLYWRLYFALT